MCIRDSNTVARAGVGRTSVFNQNTKNYQYYMDGLVRYDRTFMDRLNVNLMVGTSQEYYKYNYFNASKLDLIDGSLGVIDAATTDAAANGNANDWACLLYTSLTALWSVLIEILPQAGYLYPT